MLDKAKRIMSQLQDQHQDLEGQSIAGLFDNNPARFDEFSVKCDNLLFDYSKNNISEDTLNLLMDLAKAAKVLEKRDAMFAGDKINRTENRAVLHTALRSRGNGEFLLDGHNIMDDILAVRNAMGRFTTEIRNGKRTGQGGEFTDIVNIGIGGSHLGPEMAVTALASHNLHYEDAPTIHFVSNIDGADIQQVLAKVPASTTLFIIASKSFTTMETMTNAATARDWFVSHCGEHAVKDHFVAISTALDKTASFGIQKSQTFGFWDWVGGRYSIWSAIGLSFMIAIGEEQFDEFLEGAESIDRHFCEAEPRNNIPLLMGIIGIYHRNICGYQSHALLPYDQNLSRFPAYLQQLDMESNGKSVDIDGNPIDYDTGSINWGEPGTNGQHAFYQLIHQGSTIVPADFLIAAKANSPIGNHHQQLVANALAQSEALMLGKSQAVVEKELQADGLDNDEISRLAPHKVFSGNRPSNTILYPKLTPFVLGQLIAIYEHKVFVQGAIWNINSFDQWGVELGKQLASELLPLVAGQPSEKKRNGSTQGLLAALKDLQD